MIAQPAALFLALAAALFQTQPLSIDVRVTSRWVVTEAAKLRVEITNHTPGQILVDSVRVRLAPELVCGLRSDLQTVELDDPLTDPGASTSVPFEIPAGGGGCVAAILPRLGLSEVSVSVWYQDEASMEIEAHASLHHSAEASVPWIAPMPIVILGALLGVLLANLLLFLGRITGRLQGGGVGARSWIGELAFGFVAVSVVVVLARLVPASDQPTFMRQFVTETFGHGLILGLMFNVVGLLLLGFIQKGDKSDPPSPKEQDGPPTGAAAPKSEPAEV